MNEQDRSKRRPPNLSEKVETLTAQAFCACPHCLAALRHMIRVYGETRAPQRLVAGCVEYHHIDERANGGADHPDNYAALTKECHSYETNGPAGSKSKVARQRRRERAKPTHDPIWLVRVVQPIIDGPPSVDTGERPTISLKPGATPGLMFPKPARKPKRKWGGSSFQKGRKRRDRG